MFLVIVDMVKSKLRVVAGASADSFSDAKNGNGEITVGHRVRDMRRAIWQPRLPQILFFSGQGGWIRHPWRFWKTALCLEYF